MTPLMPHLRARRRRAEHSFFVPLVLALACLVVLAATLPLTGARVPGMYRVQSLLARVPQPWKPPRPEYVALPEAASQTTSVLVAESVQAAPLAGAMAGSAAGAVAAHASTSEEGQSGQGEPAPLPEAAPQAVPVPAALEPLPAPPPAFQMQGFRHQWQTWNNCGPATISMAISYFGRPETQAQAAAFLKPNANDKNVSPDELVAFVRSVGLQAQWLVNGDMDTVKRLIASGVPVVVEVWYIQQANDQLGHYRLLTAYDDATARFFAHDSLVPPGVNVPVPYARFDADWRVFNRTYIPVYPAEKADVVARIVGSEAGERSMWERALAVAQAEAAAQPNDAFAWFNVGTNLVSLGRTAEAVVAFDRARSLRLPWRMLWYQFAPFEAYLAEGRLNDVLTLTGANLQQTNDLEESHYYRGRALQAQGNVAGARLAYQTAVRLNPRYMPAHHALSLLG